MSLGFRVAVAAFGAVLGVLHAAAGGAEKSAADLLPGSAVAYVELSDPKSLLATVLDHPLRERIEAIPEIRKALDGKELAQIKPVLAHVERQLGMKWRTALETIAEGGITAAFDPNSLGGAVLVKSADEKTLVKARDLFLQLARDDAKRKGQPDPVQISDYRKLDVHRMGPILMTTFGPWLVVTNSAALGQRIADAYLDGSDKTLAKNPQFAEARKTTRDKSPTVWAYVNVKALRDFGLAKEVFKEKADNPGAEILAGGVLSTLRETPYATAAIYVEKERLALSLAVPHDPKWVAKPRSYFFGPTGRGAAPEPLRPKNELLSLRVHRDLSGLWLAAADLFPENVNAELSQAESNLSTFFSGRDFGKEVLGAFGPAYQFVAARQTFDAKKYPVPGIKLPSFAVVFELKDPDKLRRPMKVSFQSIVGFLNIVGAQNGLPQLEQETEKRGDATVLSASYPVDEAPKGGGEAKLHYNFSPSLAMVGDRLILSSTRDLSLELIELATAKTPPRAESARVDNTVAEVRLPMLREVLSDNRAQLVAQRMLEKGTDKSKAEKDIDGLLMALGWLRDASLRLSTEEKMLRLDAEVTLRE